MAKVIIPDPDRISSNDPQLVGEYGEFPRTLDETDHSEREWRSLIKEHDLPLKIVDRQASKLSSAEEGTAVEDAVKGDREDPAAASSTQPDPNEAKE